MALHNVDREESVIMTGDLGILGGGSLLQRVSRNGVQVEEDYFYGGNWPWNVTYDVRLFATTMCATTLLICRHHESLGSKFWRGLGALKCGLKG